MGFECVLQAVRERCDVVLRQRMEYKIQGGQGPGWGGRERQGAGELIALLHTNHIKAEIAFTLVFLQCHMCGEIPTSLWAEINIAVSGWASIKLLGNEAYNPHAEVNTARVRFSTFEETGTYFSESRVSCELLQLPVASGSSLVLLSWAEWTFDGGCSTSEVRELLRN